MDVLDKAMEYCRNSMVGGGREGGGGVEGKDREGRKGREMDGRERIITMLQLTG